MCRLLFVIELLFMLFRVIYVLPKGNTPNTEETS
ncbi:hypothetical protein THDSLph1_CDS0067 [Terrisporobacter phage TPDSL_ph1]